MQDRIKIFVEHYMKERTRRRRTIAVLLLLSLFVATGVFWKLKLDGIALAGEAFCGEKEHVHDDSCVERVLICTEAEGEGHTHTDACYEVQRTLACQAAEHTHGAECYAQEEVLICTEEESETHTHSAENGCYSTKEVLVCEVPEHTHTDACYIEEKVLICGQEETSGHTHTDACYEERITCGQKEHTHTAMCYSNPKADLESSAVWEATLPDKLTDNWSDNLLAVAKSQLGYKESLHNYILDEDGKSKLGYSRYGEWYGNKYGHWCAMYVSFCLNYAGIPREAVPYEAGCHAWTVKLRELGLYETSAEYEPKAGDIIFFDYKGSGKANHVGIVTALEEKDNGGRIVHTIEGNASDKVCENTYKLSDKSILGYGDLAKAEERYRSLYEKADGEETAATEETEPDESALTAVIYTDKTYEKEAEDDNTKIIVKGNLPEGALVKAYPVETEIENHIVEAAYDITVFDADGAVYEPGEGETLEVQFVLPASEETGTLSVYYVPDAPEKPEKIDTVVNEGEITFKAEHFSVYAVARAIRGVVTNEEELKNTFAAAVDNDTVQLGADFETAGTITINKTVTLDLNGHKLTVTGNDSLFNVSAGTLTIIDSRADVTTGQVFKYSVMETTVTNSSTGATNETIVDYEIYVSGAILAGNATVVTLSGGTVNLESGTLSNGRNRAVNMNGGTLNLNGGYIYGFKKTGAINTGDTNFGGAILASGGTVNLSGTVLAKNEALNGGAIYVNNSAVNISGGVISENKSTRQSNVWDNHSEGAQYRCGGGGIFCDGHSVINMEGGYITNNTAEDEGYFDGGGGVLLAGTSEFTLDGGYITGNEAAGGGGVRSDWGKGTLFTMNGGFISGNTARSAEGGGVAITQGGNGVINGGHITNNKIVKTNHWGGGGLFCSDGAYLRVYRANITANSAGGFGGGVAGCSTGRVYVCVKNGGAVYDNDADGQNLSGGGSQKNEDHTYAANSPVFMANGYQDYFCALNSLVEGGMLGGGTANWSGSMDGVAVSNVLKEDVLEAAYVMGLTANPSETDIQSAQTLARVYINGNDSYTHGGGILCNGYLLIGDKNPIAVGSRFSMSGTKVLKENGNKTSLNGYAFKFSVKDEAETVVSVGTSDVTGKITFDRLLSFSEEVCKSKIHNNGESAIFDYILTEDAQQENLDIAIDPTQYKISVTITRTDENIPFQDENGNTIVRAYYKITGVTVMKKAGENAEWQEVRYTWTPSNDEQHAGSLEITKDTTFTNEKKQKVSLVVRKEWIGEGDNLPESITVYLKRDGEIIDTQVITADNNWTYKWDNLADGFEYTVEEKPIPGYETTITTGTGSGTEDVSGWVLADQIEVGKIYLIVANDNTALTGNPAAGGAYDFGTNNFKPVTKLENDIISDTDITEAMKWEAVTVNGKSGIYLKNAPSDKKHYLSYQNTNIVKASSTDTSYASQAVIENECLKLNNRDGTNDIKFVTKTEAGLKASSESTNAVHLYVWSGAENENVITITNTKVSKLYDLCILKVSATDWSKTLAGAKFQLFDGDNVLHFRYEEESGKYVFETDSSAETDLITGEDGSLYLSGLPKGTYTLKEIEAPNGYGLADDKTITLDDNSANVTEITVEDEEILYHLPETGGSGTFWYYFGGLMLVLVSLARRWRTCIRKQKR